MNDTVGIELMTHVIVCKTYLLLTPSHKGARFFAVFLTRLLYILSYFKGITCGIVMSLTSQETLNKRKKDLCDVRQTKVTKEKGFLCRKRINR